MRNTAGDIGRWRLHVGSTSLPEASHALCVKHHWTGMDDTMTLNGLSPSALYRLYA